MKRLVLLSLVLWIAASAFAQDSLNVRRVGILHLPATYKVLVVGNYAYVAAGYNLGIVDVSNPAVPVLAGQDTAIDSWYVAVRGGLLYTASSGLSILSLANPAAPTLIGHCAGLSGDFVLLGDYVYQASSLASLRIINVASPTEPAEVGTCVLPMAAFGIAAEGNYIYVGTHDGLCVLDISNPLFPVQIAYVDTLACEEMVISGRYLYAMSYWRNGFFIVDISNPSSPVQLEYYDVPPHANSAAIVGNYAYVGNGYYGLRVLNIANPVEPVETGFYDTPGYARQPIFANDLVFVADEDNLGIYDCSAATSVGNHANTMMPTHFSLRPCFPNPFNATTTIAYELPSNCPVRLDVLDVLGRRVQQFNYGMQTAGTHEMRYDAAGMASGVYFVRLAAGANRADQKIVLLK